MRPEKWPAANCFALVFFVALAAALTAQDFQIRTRIDLVVVPVSVKGDHDRLVAGLNKDDFVILEDGKKQVISNFSVDPVPISAVVLIDDGLSPPSFLRIQDSIPALATAFSESDEVAAYRFNYTVTKLTDFTTDLAVLEAALKTLQDSKPSATRMVTGPFASTVPVINGMPITPAVQVGVPIPSSDPTLLDDAIFTAAEDLASRDPDRRKMILVISDGRNRGNTHSKDETIDRLLDRGIEVYAAVMDLKLFSGRLSVLDSYADATGGDTCFVRTQNALESCYARSAAQARNQYVLGYVSNNDRPANTPLFRRIDVTVAGRGDDTRHRKGYFQSP